MGHQRYLADPRPIGEWLGVTTDSTGRVVGLRARWRGEIPPELANLTNLQELSIYGDRLSGCIPSALNRRNQEGNPVFRWHESDYFCE